MRHLVPAIALILGATAPAAAAPGDMTVGEFLDKATTLKARGMLAVLSSDYRLLKNEAAGAWRNYSMRLAGERAEGRSSSCPPRSIKVDTNVVLGYLQTYPAAERGRVDLHQAVADYSRRTWPCRAPQLARYPR